MPLTAKKQQEILDEAFWLYYCCCFSNCGIRPDASCDPLCASVEKTCCLRGNTEIGMGPLNDMSDGLCGFTYKTCCFVEEFSLPPSAGSPGITICGTHIALGDKEAAGSNENVPFAEKDQDELQEAHKGWMVNVKKVNYDTWWLAYFVCFGVGFNPKITSPVCLAHQKCLCSRTATLSADCISEHDGLCRSMGKNCCFVSHCEVPPRNVNFVLFNTGLTGEKKILAPYNGTSWKMESAPDQQGMDGKEQ